MGYQLKAFFSLGPGPRAILEGNQVLHRAPEHLIIVYRPRGDALYR